MDHLLFRTSVKALNHLSFRFSKICFATFLSFKQVQLVKSCVLISSLFLDFSLQMCLCELNLSLLRCSAMECVCKQNVNIIFKKAYIRT